MDRARCEQGLKALLEKYGVQAPDRLGMDQAQGVFYVVAGQERIALMPWRRERRMIEMRDLKNGGRAGVCLTLRSGRFVAENRPLKEELIRELDLCEWLLADRAASVYAVMNGAAANLIVTMQSGVVCTLEVSATLAEGRDVMDRHEINTRRGVISDRAVDTQTPQSSVYLFSHEREAAFTDVDFELYGLNAEQTAAVRDAFEVVRGDLRGAYAARRAELERLLSAACESAKRNWQIRLC